jgi:hypothetical protein
MERQSRCAHTDKHTQTTKRGQLFNEHGIAQKNCHCLRLQSVHGLHWQWGIEWLTAIQLIRGYGVRRCLQELGLMACSDSEFNSSEFMNLWTFSRTLWMGDQCNTKPLPTWDNTTQKNTDTHPCLKWDSNPWSQCSSCKRQYVPHTMWPLGLAGHGIRQTI